MWNKLNDSQQYYTESNDNDGIPIIYIHGFPFDHTMWDGQINILPERFRSITYDVRGHGQSESLTVHYNFEFFVDDLFALIDILELKNPILCGLSMGGYIALRANERRPNSFKALILSDTRSEGDSNEAKIKRATAIKSIEEQGAKKYAEDSVKNLFWEENLKANIPAVEKIKAIIENTSTTTLCGTLMALAARTDTTESLENITIPTLIMVGEHDPITPPIAAESLHERINDSELKVIKNAAHLSNLENPEQFNSCLLEFLEKIQ